MPCEHKFIHDLDLSYVKELGFTIPRPPLCPYP